MSVKINGHTIASKLRKMFSSNGQTVAANLDGEIPSGGGSGGSGGALIVTMTKDGAWSYTADKTVKEIFDAAKTSAIIVHWPDEESNTDRYEPVYVCLEGGSPYIYYGQSGYIYVSPSDDNATSWHIPD